MGMTNFEDFGVTGASVKLYDAYNRLYTKTFSTLDSAREFYREMVAAKQANYVKLVAFTIEGPITLGEYRRPE